MKYNFFDTMDELKGSKKSIKCIFLIRKFKVFIMNLKISGKSGIRYKICYN